LKILHLLYESEGDYFGIGGVGIRAYEIYSRLKERHDITLLCKRYPGARDREILGLRHIFAGTESKSLTIALLSYAWHAARFVRKYGESFDIIVEEFSPAIPTFLNFYKKTPVILQIQGYTGEKYFMKYNIAYATFLYAFERLMPNYYNIIISVSQKTSKKLSLKGFSTFIPNRDHSLQPAKDEFADLISNSKKSKKIIAIISNGIPSELLSIKTEESDYILYIGRIDIYGKGLEILLKGFSEFHKIFPHIRLLVAGDGRDMRKFKGMLMNMPLHIRNKVELVGWVSGSEKIEIISRALFCVFPSRHEVHSIALLECLACGKPVMVSDISEFSFIADIKAGSTFKTEDPSSLALSMKELMISSEREKMGRNGRDYVRDFTWEKIALIYEEFLLKYWQLRLPLRLQPL